MRKLNWLLVAILVLVLIWPVAAVPQAVQAVGKTQLNRALLATVRVAVPIAGEKDTYSTGSGTVLTTDGFILTNFHVMGDVDKGTLYNRDGLAFIAVNPTNLRGLPTWLYQAEMVRGDPKLDLALLKITGYLESDEPLPDDLGLVSIELGDSDQVSIGDELSVIGFPGLGGDTVTFTQGSVSGFLDEDRDGVIEWIKTDAEVNHGNSGGLAINENGEMIGVPTMGVTDVEAAGKISLVRPINLALPLLRTGTGFGAAGPGTTSAACGEIERHPSGATISNLVFARAVDRKGTPSGEATSFESGTDAVYAVFDYDRFRNGRQFRYTWYLDDEKVYEDVISWRGGSRGTEWVNIYSDPSLPDGVYRLEMRYDDVLLACGTFTVGKAVEAPAPAAAAPAFGPITFASGQRNDQPVGAGTQFPSGTEEIYAFFDYSGMSNGLEWRQVWYVEGEVGLDSTDTWSAGEEGNYWISVNSRKGLPDGKYLLELYVEGELVQSGEFSIGQGMARPVPSSEGVIVVGTVVDANRRSRPIPEALVLFLKPGVNLQTWVRTQDKEDIHAGAVTDANGQYQLSAPVQPGETYPVIVLAEGYRPVVEEAYTVPANAESPFELNITMVAE